jgi:hypothetical protein
MDQFTLKFRRRNQDVQEELGGRIDSSVSIPWLVAINRTPLARSPLLLIYSATGNARSDPASSRGSHQLRASRHPASPVKFGRAILRATPSGIDIVPGRSA